MSNLSNLSNLFCHGARSGQPPLALQGDRNCNNLSRVSTLTFKYPPLQEEVPTNEAYEHSEMLLYKAQVCLCVPVAVTRARCWTHPLLSEGQDPLLPCTSAHSHTLLLRTGAA